MKTEARFRGSVTSAGLTVSQQSQRTGTVTIAGGRSGKSEVKTQTSTVSLNSATTVSSQFPTLAPSSSSSSSSSPPPQSLNIFHPLSQSSQSKAFAGLTERHPRYDPSTVIELASISSSANAHRSVASASMSNSSPNGVHQSQLPKATGAHRRTGITMNNTHRNNGHQANSARSSLSSSSPSGSTPISAASSSAQPITSANLTTTIAVSTTTATRRRSEIDPLLSPPYDPTYSTNDSIHHNSAIMDHSSPSTSSTHRTSLHRNDEDTIVEFGQDDEMLDDRVNPEQELLIVDKPVQIRTQQSNANVFLLNFLALAFVSINMTLNLTVLAIIHERVPMKEPHLPDIAFDIFPDIRSLLDVSEYYIVFQMTSVFALLFFHRHRSIILRRVCIIMGVIYFFRGICMASTQLPLASKNYTCSPQLKNSSDYANMTAIEFIGIISSRVFYMSLGMGLSINGHHNYCGDYIFSGHTVILLLTYLTFQEYLVPQRRKNIFWRFYQLFLMVMTVVSIICIIIARGHYFIDVILAYFVTTRIFWIYHAMCNSSLTNMKSFTSYFSRLWWWPVFLYFENIKPISNLHSIKSDEPPNLVQRVFEWPLPYPKQFARRKHRNQFMA